MPSGQEHLARALQASTTKHTNARASLLAVLACSQQAVCPNQLTPADDTHSPMLTDALVLQHGCQFPPLRSLRSSSGTSARSKLMLNFKLSALSGWPSTVW